MFYNKAVHVHNMVHITFLYIGNNTFPVYVVHYSSPSDKQLKSY